jgi:LacI family transcriptional regulator
MSATIRDVAREAGVSIKTVSRVINEERNVAPATSQAVLAAIAALDYHPNQFARSLRTGASDTIGVVVDSLNDPFFATIISIAEKRAMAEGLDILVASTGADATRAPAQIARLVRRRVRGLLVTPFGEGCAAALPANTAAVLIDRQGEGLEAFDSVMVANESTAAEAVKHLITHGHRNIGFLGSSFAFETVRARADGFRRTLTEAGIPVEERWVDAAWGTSAAEAAASRMLALDETPTAIFAATPMAGQGVFAAMRAAGRSDIALLVFGDFPMAGLLDPGITVVDQNPEGQAEVAMDRLFARISGDDGPAVRRVVPTSLIVRGSAEIPPSLVTGSRS